jgi:hypothetical protein
MSIIERRIAALEQASVEGEELNKVVVFPLDGENTADALVRSSYPANILDALFVRFVKASHDNI